jgi:hypothetical protein
VNLGFGGNGILYGECLLVIVDNNLPVPVTVHIPEGLLLTPDDEEIGNFIVTRYRDLDVPAGGSIAEALVGAAQGTSDKAPGFLTFFEMNGTAQGAQARIVNKTATGSYGYEAEIVALWASGEGMDRAELKNWVASDASIAEAGRILLAANVSTPITARPPSSTPPPSAASVSGPGNTGLLVGLFVAAALAIAGASARASAKKHRALYGPPTVRGPSRPPTSAGPQAPPKVASFARSPGGAPAPVAAPVEAPWTPPVLAIVPTEPPAAPSALLDATAGCPQCALPVAVGAPRCPACGLDIVWG